MKSGSREGSLKQRTSLVVKAFCGAVSVVAALSSTPAQAQNPAQTITVDAAANRHPISPLIYGTAFATPAQLLELNSPLNRSGGNHTSRYNWQLNADNRAFDWFFESIGKESATPGEEADTFIANNKANGAESMVTIPTIGWVAKLGPNRGKLSSFSVQKYGPQQYTDYWMPDAGNGKRPDGSLITGNDPNDASLPVDSAFQRGWIDHLVNRWGTAANGGLKYYIMDNEPSIWFSTHRDVRPTGVTMEQVRNDLIAYGSQVKAADPTAQVVGPEEWGWSGYILSGYDQQYGAQHGWGINPDRTNHGGMDYLPWLLQQLRQHETQTGKRLLDVFSVHYYPQGGEYSSNVHQDMQLRRNRSTRSLWDPNYVDETWISDRVQLVPRLKNWVNTYYPGTKTGITEYNWGAEEHINGATAQADIYGIFGREGLDMANRWTTPPTSSPTFKAMKMYRNYDGRKSTFGDTSVQANVANPDNLSAFAAVRSSDGALTVMVVSKYLSGNTPVNINLANFAANTAQVWQLSSSNSISRLADINVSGGAISTTVPSPSVTLFVISTAPTQGFSVRGRITTSSGSPLSGISVSRNGTGNVATNANGEYVFANVPPGTYAITPVAPASLNGATFTPPSADVTVSSSNLSNINFTALFTISGRVANHSGAGIANVQVKRVAGSSTVSTFTDASGNYRFTGVRSGSYAISPVLTPAMSGVNFTPASLNVTVDKANITNINFLGVFSVSGRVANHSGVGIANVQVQRKVGNSVVSAFTDSNGNYRFSDVRSGSYTLAPVLTPAMSGMSFTPTVLNITVGTQSITNQNFIGMFSISGRITNSSGAALANVRVTRRVTGSTSETSVFTDSSGNYRFGDVRSGSYSITPSLAGRTFNPVSRNVTIATLSASNVSFIGSG